MTLIQIVDAARGLLNEPLPSSRTFPDNTSSFWTDSFLTTLVNLVQQEVQQEIIQADEGYFLTASCLNVVAGSADYSLPSGCIKIKRIEDIRQQQPTEIRPTSINLKDGLSPAYGVSGSIENRYYLRGQQIVLTDTPTFTNASAIRVHYVRMIADVSAGSENSPLPEEAHRALVFGVVRLAIQSQEGDASWCDKEFKKQVDKIKEQAENRQTQRPRSVARVNPINSEGDL